MASEHERYWYTVIVMIIVYIVFLSIGAIFLFEFMMPYGAITWVIIFIFGLILILRWHKENTAYICPNCNYVFLLTTAKDILSPNKFDKKYLMCSHCNTKQWCQAVSRWSVEDRIGTAIPDNYLKSQHWKDK